MKSRCASCGQSTPFHLLDAKPESLAGKPATIETLNSAADCGEDFEVIECERCYGPAWSAAAEGLS